MSGNDWLNKNVFNCRTDDADCTSSDRLVQKMEAATKRAIRRDVQLQCERRLQTATTRSRSPGLHRLYTGTSWFRYGGAKPINTRYAMSASLKLTHSGRRSPSAVSRERQTRGRSDEVGIPNVCVTSRCEWCTRQFSTKHSKLSGKFDK